MAAKKNKQKNKPKVVKWKPGGSLPDVRQRVIFRGHDMTEEYVNVFENCNDPDTLSHIMDLLLAGKIYPYATGTLPFEYPSTAKLPEGTLERGNAVCQNWQAVPGKKFIYQDARRCYIRLLKEFPEMPQSNPDITAGLRYMRECVGELKKSPGAKPKDESPNWTRALSAVKWANLFDIDPKTMREWFKKGKVKNEHVSPRKWKIHIGDLPAEVYAKYVKRGD